MNIIPATAYPRVTDHLQEIERITSKLIDSGHAYFQNGSVYFDVKTFPSYGQLCPNLNISAHFQQTLINKEIEKRHSMDFALWKACNNVDDIGWNSRFGRGRPGQKFGKAHSPVILLF
jgi:cysteinyl-tRNA synthetase